MMLTQFSECLIVIIILGDSMTGQNGWDCTASGCIFGSDGVECGPRHHLSRPDFRSFIQSVWTNFEVVLQILPLPLVPNHIQFGVY